MIPGPGGGRALERVLLAVASGLLLGLTFTPLGGPVLPFLAFAPLAVALHRAPGPGAGLLPGFVAATVGHGIGLQWMIPALAWRTPLAVPVWLAVLGLIGLVAALAVEGAQRLRRRSGVPLAAGLALTWVGFEWVAAHMPLVPYAWLNAGGSLVWWPWAANWVVLGGTPLLTLWTVGAGTAAAGALLSRRSVGLLWTAAVVFLPMATGQRSGVAGPEWKSVLAVQPGRSTGSEVSSLLDWRGPLTGAAEGIALDLIVFPERFLPTMPDESTGDHRLAEAMAAPLLFGGVDTLGALPERDVANAAFLVRPGASARDVVHKRRLVPWLESGGVGADWVGSLSYVSGEGAMVLDLGDWRVGVLICYDVAFPGLARDLVQRGADALVVISNDDWLDPEAPLRATVAYWQHETLGRLRAAENGIPLLQVATTGRTFSLDGRGQRYPPEGPSGVPTLETAVSRLRIPRPEERRAVPNQGGLLGLVGFLALAAGAWPDRVRVSSARG